MATQSAKYKKFIVGAASAALVASAVAPVASAASFSDTEGNTHEPAIDALTKAGVIKGYEDGTFKPNKTLKRSDVVKLMGKWLVTQGKEIPADARTNMRFSDLTPSSDKELLDYAAVVKDNKVFNGKEDGTLDAVGNITRENMALVLVRAFDQIHNIDLVSYVQGQDFDKDVIDLAKAKEEARPAIDVLDFFDITNPIAPSFNPKNTTTRGHFATFLHKTIHTDFSDVKGEVNVDKVAVEEAAKLVKDGAVSLLRGESATNENKLAAVKTYVTSLVTDKDITVTVIVGKTANDYIVTLTKGEAKVEKTIAITFELTAKDLHVTTVNDINKTGVNLRFKATSADNKDANVVVKDGAGNVVQTKSVIVAEGATTATINFTTPFAENHKFTGVWTVNGVAFNFDAINQLAAIVDAATANNQIALQSALDAAGITVADKARIGEYLTAINTEKPKTLVAVQELINKIDNDTMDAAAKAAAVKAVVEATTQQQLLNALTANFKGVNAEWALEYATTGGLLALTKVTDTSFDQIQTVVYTQNAHKITAANSAAENSVAQAKVSTLIEAWMKADGKDQTAKADALKASKVKEAAFKVAEATTPNETLAALTSYANLVEDKDDATKLKAADLNADLKAFYFAKLNKTTLVNAIKAGNVDIKTTIVTAADTAAVIDAMTKIQDAYKAINTAEATADKSTAAQKTALKTALQNLATVTAHKAATAKFDASIVIDQNLVAYAAEFAKGTVNSTVAHVVEDINTVNKNTEVAKGVVSTEAELKTALAAANATTEIETITLKNDIAVGMETLTLTSGVVIEGNGNTVYVGGTKDDKGDDKALGLFITDNAKNVTVKDLTVVGTHGDSLIEIYGDATLENVKALSGKKAGIYVNNRGTSTITVNFKSITTGGNGWDAGVGMASKKLGSKIIANFSGTNSFGEKTAVYTDDLTTYKGTYDVNGLDGYTKTLVGNQNKWTKN